MIDTGFCLYNPSWHLINLLPWACQQPRCVSEPCPPTLSAGRSAGLSCITDPPARSAGSPSHGSPGSASLPSVRWGQTTTTRGRRQRKEKTVNHMKINKTINISKITQWWCRVRIPVLDVFPNDEKVWLDESLDDLTVPLLPSRQLPGYWNGLAMKKGIKCVH